MKSQKKDNPLLTEIKNLQAQVSQLTALKDDVHFLKQTINHESKPSRKYRPRDKCSFCTDADQNCEHCFLFLQFLQFCPNGQTVSAVDSSASWVNVSRCEFKSSYCFLCGSTEHFRAGCERKFKKKQIKVLFEGKETTHVDKISRFCKVCLKDN